MKLLIIPKIILQIIGYFLKMISGVLYVICSIAQKLSIFLTLAIVVMFIHKIATGQTEDIYKAVILIIIMTLVTMIFDKLPLWTSIISMKLIELGSF